MARGKERTRLVTPVDFCWMTEPKVISVVGGADSCGAATIKIGSYTVAAGETIKITQTPGKSGVTMVNAMGVPGIKHFQVGPGDAVVTATDGSGNSVSAVCPVPPNQK